MSEEAQAITTVTVPHLAGFGYRAAKADGLSVGGPMGSNGTYSLTFFIDTIKIQSDVIDLSQDASRGPITSSHAVNVREDIVTIMMDLEGLRAIADLCGQAVKDADDRGGA